MKGLSKEQIVAAVVAMGITFGGLGYFVKQQGELTRAAKEGRAKRIADIEAINSAGSAKPRD